MVCVQCCDEQYSYNVYAMNVNTKSQMLISLKCTHTTDDFLLSADNKCNNNANKLHYLLLNLSKCTLVIFNRCLSVIKFYYVGNLSTFYIMNVRN